MMWKYGFIKVYCHFSSGFFFLSFSPFGSICVCVCVSLSPSVSILPTSVGFFSAIWRLAKLNHYIEREVKREINREANPKSIWSLALKQTEHEDKKNTHTNPNEQRDNRTREKSELLRDLMVKKCYLNGNRRWQKMMGKNVMVASAEAKGEK